MEIAGAFLLRNAERTVLAAAQVAVRRGMSLQAEPLARRHLRIGRIVRRADVCRGTCGLEAFGLRLEMGLAEATRLARTAVAVNLRVRLLAPVPAAFPAEITFSSSQSGIIPSTIACFGEM